MYKIRNEKRVKLKGAQSRMEVGGKGYKESK
jgi:hypothetical protein